jgi:hypothetical protein
MGQFCPVCELYLPVIQRLTIDQKPAHKAKDVIGARLSCGHIYYVDEYKPYMEKMNQIKTDEAEAIRKIERDTTNKLSSMWAALTEGKKEGKERGK